MRTETRKKLKRKKLQAKKTVSSPDNRRISPKKAMRASVEISETLSDDAVVD